MNKIEVSWGVALATLLFAGLLGVAGGYVVTPRVDATTEYLTTCLQKNNCIIRRYEYISSGDDAGEADQQPTMLQRERKMDEHGKVKEVLTCQPFQMPEFLATPKPPEVPDTNTKNREEVENLLMGYIEEVINNTSHNKTILNNAYLEYKSKCRAPVGDTGAVEEKKAEPAPSSPTAPSH